jgi:competence protein ComEC
VGVTSRRSSSGAVRSSLRLALAGIVAGAVAAVVVGCGSAATSGGSGAAPTPTRSPSTSPTSALHTPKPAAGGGGTAISGATTVVFVDVGQGDAIVIRSGTWTGLIDGGPAGSEPAVEAALAKLGVRRLSAVVVSHMHADHTGGLSHVVREWRPRMAYVAGRPTRPLAGSLRGAGTTVVQVRRGATFRWGAARARILSPAALSGDANSDSLVVAVEAGGKRFLFTGDCTGPNEAAVGRICARGPPVTVLKVAHHGSRFSTTSAFLAGVRPSIAVISVGPNSYGHPTPATVGRLLAGGTRVYTTWKNGAVTFTVSASGAMRATFSRSSRPVKKATAADGG